MEKEERLVEQRKIEATQKKLMGVEGKLGVVLRNLGNPIIKQQKGGAFYDSNYLEDPYAEEKEGIPTVWMGEQHNLPTWGEKEIEVHSTAMAGWVFDGLSRGMHLEIKYLEENQELSVFYKGHLVYEEVAGELSAYVPNKEWEINIEILFDSAKKIAQRKKQEDKKEIVERTTKEKLGWLEALRRRWGI